MWVGADGGRDGGASGEGRGGRHVYVCACVRACVCVRLSSLGGLAEQQRPAWVEQNEPREERLGGIE